MLLCFPVAAKGKGPRPLPADTATLKQTRQIMQKAFDFANRNFLNGLQYQSDVYVRHRAHTVRRGHLVRYLPQMFRLERGTNDYLSEAELKIQFRPPGETDCKVQAFHTTARYLPSSRITQMGRFNFEIYSTRLFADRILNPLHRRNRRFYRYRYHYASRLDTSTVAHIEITPRFANSQLVEHGEVEIDTHTGGVRKFRFSFIHQMQHFTISGQTGKGFYDRVLPVRLRILSNFRLLGNRVSEVYDVQATHRFACPSTFDSPLHAPLDLTSRCLLRIDTAHIVTDRQYFDSIRPFPLRQMEADIYRRQDSLHALRLTQRDSGLAAPKHVTADSTDGKASDLPATITLHEAASPSLKQRSRNWNDLLLDSHRFSIGQKQAFKLRLPAVITPSMVQWSGSKGLSLQTRIALTATLNRLDGELQLAPRVGYNFKQRQVYWSVPLAFTFWPQCDGKLTMEAGGGSHMYSNQQAEDVRHKLQQTLHADSLLDAFNRYEFQYYRDTHAKADFSFAPSPSLRLTAGMRYHYRSMLHWNHEAQLAQMHRTLSSIAPRVQVEWTPRTYYYREGKRRIPLYSRFPTLLLSYERGMATGTAPTAYERVEGDLRFRLPLYALRTLYFRAGGGCYLKRQRYCFLDYDYFRFNNMPQHWDDEMTGEFQLLGAQWYNESRHYVRFTSTYESPMLLLSRIPWVSRVIQTERVYCNVLSVSLLKCYTEWGYGISTNLVDLGVFTSVSDKQPVRVGFRCALRLFDD